MAKDMQTRPAGDNLPAELKDELEQAFQEEVDRGGFKLPTIKIIHASQMFEMPGGDPVKTFNGIVLGQHDFRVCWLNSGGTDEIVPPDCFSQDCVTGTAEAESAKDHNGAPVSVFGSCASCWYNQFGSGVNDAGEPTKGKRCSNKAHVLVFRADAPSAIPYILTLSVTSLRAIEALRTEGAALQLPKQAMLAEFSLEKQSRGPQVWSVVKVRRVGDVKDGKVSVGLFRSCMVFSKTFAVQLSDAPPVEVEDPQTGEVEERIEKDSARGLFEGEV